MRFRPPPQTGLETLYVEDTDAPMAGKTAGTRYVYFKTIARGGKSIIQSCKDLRLSRIICYKSLRPELSDDPVERQRFLREARVTALLQHPNTVPVYDLGEDRRGHLYFTMKFVHGYTFREILDFRDRYDLNQLVNVLIQVAWALSYAHTHGVAHRDVKPENILVGPFGEVLLMDWGLAKVWKRSGAPSEPESEGDSLIEGDVPTTLTDRGKVQGTIHYMSPEQIERDPKLDGRTDIFSLGAVLYEVLAGVPPANGETVDEVLQSVLTEVPARPSKIAKHEVPALLQDICMRCLVKDPNKRLQTPTDVVRELSEDWRDKGSAPPRRRPPPGPGTLMPRDD